MITPSSRRRSLKNNRGVSGTLFRYLVSEALFSFLVAFLFFFFIFFVNQLLLLAQEILAKKVPFHQVALLVLFAIPSIIAMSAPFASLVGILMTIGRLTSDNEILVMLSSGLPYRTIFIPTVAVGVFISLLSFYANDVLLPMGTIQFSRLWRQIMASTPALELEANSVKRFKDTVVVTGNVEGNSINDVLILDRTQDGERRLILARNAELRDAGREGLSLDMKGAFIQSSKEVSRRDYDYASATFLRYWVSQEDMIQNVSSITPSQMSSIDVLKEIRVKEAALAEKIDERYRKVTAQGLGLEAILLRGPNREDWNRRTNQAAAFIREVEIAGDLKKDRSLSRYRLEFYKKFSIPFGALSFVFLAVPLGLLAKKSGQTVGFIFGLIIAVLYWAMLLGGQTLGVRLGYSPFWCMWLPNILAVSIGLVMCLFRVRH
ncbi:MAG: LptF/LptG family permease [Spirochaetaceae bacterium]|jgi:lipopolysaccharide export system permease protein|nr:LptF/LptG family permease [Spirochaetaceae bacterium]